MKAHSFVIELLSIKKSSFDKKNTEDSWNSPDTSAHNVVRKDFSSQHPSKDLLFPPDIFDSLSISYRTPGIEYIESKFLNLHPHVTASFLTNSSVTKQDTFQKVKGKRPSKSGRDLSSGVSLLKEVKDHHFKSPTAFPPPNHRHSRKPDSFTSDYRFGKIQVDWFDFPEEFVDDSEMSETNFLSDSLDATKEDSKKQIASTSGKFTPYLFGNSTLNSGVIHLFREQSDLSLLQDSKIATSPTNKGSGLVLSVLAVPSYMTAQDFLTFIGPSRHHISHIRMIKDALPHRYMVLIKFRKTEQADEFYKQFNGRRFNSLEPEICRVVYINSIEFRTRIVSDSEKDGIGVSDIHNVTDSFFSQNSVSDFITSPTNDQTQSSNLIELPTCPVCLERMDPYVSGLLTIICQHTFHCNCLSKWNDSTCPVCRYSFQKQYENEQGEANECNDCFVSENLWICLICGNIGCGRYQSAHAQLHFETSSHCYSMELETQRVWDYVGDGYVHRLIQNKTDGKLVEVSAPGLDEDRRIMSGREGDDRGVTREKFDAVAMEYSFLLTSQLESQREYYESQLQQLQQKNKTQIGSLSGELENIKQDKMSVENSLEKVAKEKLKLEKRLEKILERVKVLEREVEEEKQMNQGMRTNQLVMKGEIEKRDKDIQSKVSEIEEFQAQVKDLMFYIETLQKVQSREDLAGGQIVIEQKPIASSSGGKKKGKK
ncbi:hypothetical protein HK096_003170 [Nowakowskiella sp. JEL0078]|nr:hypothetical protein HK096_003170 [Nowakowskiella sp. JEL0078]